MKAIRIHQHGDRSVLNYDDIDYPRPEDDKVILEVKSVSINHLDIWVRKGWPGISIDLPFTMGSDASGIIVDVGKNIKDWKVGDSVVIQPGTFCGNCSQCMINKENYCSSYGILGESENGVQAEYISVYPENLFHKPQIYTFEEAASMPLVFMTAFQMLISRANLNENETVLIYGGSSGVGSAAIQIAKSMNATVIATVGSDSKRNYVYDMGADYIVNHNNTTDLYNQIIDIVGKNKINVIFEHVGSQTWNNSIRLLSKGGRLVTCGATTGSMVNIDLKHLFMKQQTIIGSTMSDIPSFKAVMNKINIGLYKPFVDKIFKFKDIKYAHEYIEESKHMGKIVLIP